MGKSILVIDTPNSCKECSLVMGKLCPALDNVDLSPCKALGIRHSGCPLISEEDYVKTFSGRRLKQWTELLNS